MPRNSSAPVLDNRAENRALQGTSRMQSLVNHVSARSEPTRFTSGGSTTHSARESSRPFGDEIADVQRMINDALTTASAGSTITAGNGVTLTGTTLDVNSSLPFVTSVGTLTGLTVDGSSTFEDPVTFTNGFTSTGAVTVPAFASTGAATFDGGVTFNDPVTLTDSLSVTSLVASGSATLTDATLSGFLKVAKCMVTPMQYFAPAEGDVVTAASSSPGLVLNPAAPLAALTVVFPATPQNGQRFSVHSTQNVTAVTFTASFATGNAPPAGITAGTPISYIWNSDVVGWFVM